MLSLFPELLDWGWYVPFFFRIFLACYILSAGYCFIKLGFTKESQNGSAHRMLGGLLVILGLGFLIGIAVQPLGAVGFVTALVACYFKNKKSSFTTESVNFYLLIGLVSLSLVFLGPGPYSFDLPL